MQNFFNSNKGSDSTSLNNQYDNLKENYRIIFIEAAESIRREIEKFRPENPCTLCTIKNCKIEKKDVFADYPVGCPYRNWQKEVLNYLFGEYKQKLRNISKLILDKKNEISCSKCACCCKLSTSEYSYEQLKQKAARGDKFSRDFVSVFVPYNNDEEAKSVNPEFFELLNSIMEDQKVYYYHCPKLKDNLCSDYENRPDICKDFPHNPLKLLPSACSFNTWKNAVSRQAMLIKAKADIIEFYKAKLG